MTLGKLLVQRGKQGRWYLRVAVPRPLQRAWGKRERIKALGTSDRALAEERALPILTQWRAEERQALGQASPLEGVRRVPTPAELEDVALLVGHELVIDEGEKRLNGIRGMGPELWRANADWIKLNLDDQAYLTATGDVSAVRSLADEANEALELGLTPDSEAYAHLCDMLNRVRLDALKVSHQRATGNVEAESDSRLVRQVRDRQAAKAKQGETLPEVFERWAADRLAKGEKRPDTVNQDRKVVEQFAAFVGKDRAIRSITPEDVADYRDRLRDLPPKWMSKKELRGLSMREAAAKARELGFQQTAFTTVNKHLSTISPLYKWLAGQPAWAGLVNPCNGLFHDKVKGKNRRPPFSTAQLNKILQSPLFTGFMGEGKEHLPGNQRADDWRRWIPLVCLFTGARIGEIAQLRIGDVRQERGVWFVHIRHAEGEGLTTKSGKSRPAAVHSMLQRIGFLAFHQHRLEKAGGDMDAPMFPELEVNSRGQISGTPSRWWRDYLEGIGVKNGRDGFGAHSFRHTLADRLRSEAELLDNEVAVILGHSVATTTSGYGALSQGTVTKFQSWIEAVIFDGVSFEHLIDV